MSGYLLVPTNVQAFLVGQPADLNPFYDLALVPQTTADVVNWYRHPKYSFSFQPNKPKSPLEPGVHLHWALPAALMHARHEGNKEPAQPCIPNRWLVVRMWHAEDKKSKAWVVESDYISDDAASGGAPFIFVNSVDEPSVDFKYIGRAVQLESWQETHPQYRFELKSHGWGDPSFAAYYPACKGVLGFHDPLDGDAKGNLTYLVIGWYSDPARDPFYPGTQSRTLQECKDRLVSLRWSCALEGSAGAALPQQTLCHGGVVGIEWQGTGQKYPAASARTTTPTVAIGGSAAEAIAALLDQKKDKSLQQVLCAFQHGQATQVSDYYQLGELLHRHSFNAVPGGTLWTIEPVARSADAQSSPRPVSGNVQKLLGELNQVQREYDQHAREIESLRSRLFACWVTWACGTSDRTLVRPAENAMQSATSELPRYQNDVDVCKKSVTAALIAENTGMQLAESTMPPFLHPKDPFVVLKGENLVGIDRARPQHPDQDADDALRLRCRLAKEVVTGVSQSGPIFQRWEAAKCLKLDFPDVAGVPHGEVARTVGLETLLFDPNCAGLIKTNDDALFKVLQTSLDPTRTSNTNKLTWIGQPPDPLGITRWGGNNPWLPVYLMWQAYWAPAYAPAQGSDNSHSKALDCWQLESDRARLHPDVPFDPLVGDLVPQSNTPTQSTGNPPQLEGATIISVLSDTQLAKSLSEFAEAAKRDANLETIKLTQVLGQSLGGFNDLLLCQTLGLCLPPVDPTKENGEVDAGIWDAMGKAPQPVMPVIPFAGTFFPVRAGALRLVSLYIVDTFGQTRKLLDSTNSWTQSFSPRLVQPARLNFDWQPADDGASGPVCGWIVANFLERSFAVFSASGEPLGSLLHSNVTFRWQPTPGTDLQPDKILNTHLQRFVKLATNFSADEGQAFLELVELVLRKTEARLPSEDPAMAVLLGRPLALVQASLGLEVKGLPAGYWKTAGAWKFETEGFEKLRVQVRLGGMNLAADGLVGYLLENGDRCFFASEGAKRRLDKNTHINYDQALTVASTDSPPLSLTLLMDARARVHATTGILPRHFIQLPPATDKQLGLIEEVYFRVAPVLGVRPQESAAQPAMPRPSDAFGQWSWATRPALGWQEICSADDRARFADGLALSEGWLKLRVRRDQGKAQT